MIKPTYPGKTGKIHGEKKLRIPPVKAAIKLTVAVT
jgi:hypothetical protein